MLDVKKKNHVIRFVSKILGMALLLILLNVHPVYGEVVAKNQGVYLQESTQEKGQSTIKHTPVENRSRVKGFQTGHHILLVKPATIDNHGRSLIAASYDGKILSYSEEGRIKWRAETGGHIPFDMAVEDLDGDGYDETMVASSDGSLYVLNHEGHSLWTFDTKAPLYNVATLNGSEGKKYIVIGGVDKTLYKLSKDGQVISTSSILSGAATERQETVIRHIKAADVFGNGKEYLVVVSVIRDNSNGSLSLIDPDDMDNPRWTVDFGPNIKTRYKYIGEMLIQDLDKDGESEILLPCGKTAVGDVIVFNCHGEYLKKFDNPSKERGKDYRMNFLSYVNIPSQSEEYVLGFFQNKIIVHDLEGQEQGIYTSKHAFASGTLDPVTNTYYIASDVSGGDAIYALKLDTADWGEAFENIEQVGRINEIRQNIQVMNQQLDNFVMPAYQDAISKGNVVVRGSFAPASYEAVTNGSTSLSSYAVWSEKYPDDVDPFYLEHKDKRRKYDMTAEEIIAAAAAFEANGQDFSIWAGHGKDPYMQVSTYEGILKAAPNHCKLLIFSEMETMDEDTAYFINHILVPLADACKEQGNTKILMRNKYIFWAGQYYLDFGKALFNNKYKDVIVPSTEDTNCRSQEVNFAGRLGLWLTGQVKDLGGRLIEDNNTFVRQFEWSAQMTKTAFIRNMVHNLSFGAKYFHNSNPSIPEEDQLAVVYKLVDKGALVVPDREDVLSIPSVALGMRTPHEDYIKHGTNGHYLNAFNGDDNESYVFDHLDCYWGGYPIADYDFSNYGYGAKSRTVNFLPTTPYGMIPIIPDDYDIEGTRFTHKISTDGKYFYDESGNRHTAEAYKSTVQNLLRKSRRKMPVVVSGQVAWNVIRIDDQHVRVILMDSGYADPKKRQARIRLQTIEGITCQDILSGETLPIEDNQIHVTVPAGVFRILDITHGHKKSDTIDQKVSMKLSHSEPIKASHTESVKTSHSLHDATQAFETGHTMYHVKPVTLKGGIHTTHAQLPDNAGRAIVGAAYDGTVAAYTANGIKLWENKDNKSFPYDVTVGDIDLDGLDEVCMASSDGCLYTIDDNGETLFVFDPTANQYADFWTQAGMPRPKTAPPLYTVCITTHDGEPFIYTGGISRIIFKLNGQGDLLPDYAEGTNVIRELKAGDTDGNGTHNIVALATYRANNTDYLQLYNGSDLSERWSVFLQKGVSQKFIGRFLLEDIDDDHQVEILLNPNKVLKKQGFDESVGKIRVYEPDGTLSEKRYDHTTTMRGRDYKMNFLTKVVDPITNDTYIVGFLLHQIVVHKVDGTLIGVYNAPMAYTNAAYDAITHQFIMGSETSGGDAIYVLDCKNGINSLIEQFQEIQSIGRSSQIQQNIQRISNQVNRFVKPSYQQASSSGISLTQSVFAPEVLDAVQNGSIDFATLEWRWSEDFDRTVLSDFWAKKRDNRRKYDMTAEEIIQQARAYEARGEDFTVWAGHGQDPFYMQLSTLKGIMDAAPNHCKMFIYPEIGLFEDENTTYAIEHLFIPLADYCQAKGSQTKICFRNKFAFWASDCYIERWRPLFNGKYKDVIIPSMEETTCRTQEMSLAGRVGLWLTDRVEDWSGRTVEDNAVHNRQFHWATQVQKNAWIRNMVYNFSLGSTYMNPKGEPEGDPCAMVYKMIDKGLLLVPEKEDLLSITDVALAMREPDPTFFEHSVTHAKINTYDSQNTHKMVFDRLDSYWSGAPVESHDFSSYGYGIRERALNFMPTTPYGFVPIIPDDFDITNSNFKDKITTDGKYFYDENGQAYKANVYKRQVVSKLKAARKKLPFYVEGDVAWNVVQVDETHARIYLIDSGYLNPSRKKATVVVNNVEALACQDMLSGQNLAIENNRIHVTVPAGVFRIIDVTYEP